MHFSRPGWPDRYGFTERQRREAWPISRGQAVMVSEAVERRINRYLPRLRFFSRALWPDYDDLPKLL